MCTLQPAVLRQVPAGGMRIAGKWQAQRGWAVGLGGRASIAGGMAAASTSGGGPDPLIDCVKVLPD